MSPTSTPPGPTIEPELLPEPETSLAEPAPIVPADPEAPLTFIPHTAEGAVGNQPVRIRTGRYGVLEEHELVRLLDSIEDERARGRFRESIYVSVFVWIFIAGLVLFGPKYLWHAPKIRNFTDVLKEHELASVSLPPAPRLSPPPTPLNNKQLDQLRTMTREAARRAPSPAPTPAPAPPPANLPNAPTPSAAIPKPPPPNVQPQPSRLPPPAIADAPTPQTPTRPNFNTGNGTAGQDIQQALNNVARSPRGGGGDYGAPSHRDSPLNTGYEILSPNPDNVDLEPYIRRILADIKRNWLPLLPEETRPPLMKTGEDQIRFKIGPDGTILAMVPEGSTHDQAIDRSCWSAITSENQFPPLPKEFHGPNLELRLRFYVNEKPE